MTGKFVIENVPMPDGVKPAAPPSPSWSVGQLDPAAGMPWDRGQGSDSQSGAARRVGLEKVFAEPVGTPPAKYARAKLNTANEVADEIARIYRLAKAGRMDSAVATKLTYILATLAKVRGDGDLERRIEALEARRIG